MLLFIIACLVFVVGVIALIIEEARPYGIAAVICAIVFAVVTCIASVPTGHTGVVSNFGKIENYTLEAGVHMKAPWSKIIKMDNRTQKGTLDMTCFSQDIQQVTVAYTLNYQISKENAQTIYKTIGKHYYDTVVTPCIQEALKTVVAQYTAEQLVSSRSELACGVEDELAGKLKQYNIVLVATSIENMDFSDAFEQAVEQKQVAQQNKLKAETEAAQKIVEAEAAAKAKIIAADAEAKANKTVSQSLTDDILYQQWLKKWDGKLPQVAGADANVIIGDLTANGETK